MNNNAIITLSNAISELQLSADAAMALTEIALDPHGIEKNAAAGLVASILDISLERANQALIELFGKNLLVTTESDGEMRLFANYNLLGVDETTRKQLIARQEIFENMKEAHSKASMKSLNDFFYKTEETIYMGCEVTSHHTFPRLEARAESGRKTIFLMPRKRDVSEQRQTHYAEVMSEWVLFLKSGPASLRKNVRIKITSRPYPQLYTSGLSSETARFNLYFLSAKTTRQGSLLQIKNGTSLYQLVYQNYYEAVMSSCPLWRVWFFEALWHWIKKLILPITLIVIGGILTKLQNPIAIAISAIAIGLVKDILWNSIGKRWWNPITLFKK